MSADEGKLSLEDSPRRHLPYFKLQDPDADSRVKIRDLLTHRTGLDGTDIAWYTGGLSREEAIRTAGNAKPTAKLGEKFQYQNVMYSAAGEVVARAEGTTWELVIANRFFKPLGMKSSNTSVKETLASHLDKEFSRSEAGPGQARRRWSSSGD
jgi:CubicO group peptidase (beta-lactamase class C family)